MADAARPCGGSHIRPYNERLARAELSTRDNWRRDALATLSERAEKERMKEEARALRRKRRTALLDVDALAEASRKIIRADNTETLEQLAENVAVDPKDKSAVIMVLANLKWSHTKD